jgi:hypothetical protein
MDRRANESPGTKVGVFRIVSNVLNGKLYREQSKKKNIPSRCDNFSQAALSRPDETFFKIKEPTPATQSHIFCCTAALVIHSANENDHRPIAWTSRGGN